MKSVAIKLQLISLVALLACLTELIVTIAASCQQPVLGKRLTSIKHNNIVHKKSLSAKTRHKAVLKKLNRHKRALARKKPRRIAQKPRYAYPVNFFMQESPFCDHNPLAENLCKKVRECFNAGIGSNYPPNYLIKANIASFYPLKGGIFQRREQIRYIVLHSTETAIPLGAKRVVDSWNSGGRRHPGTPYVVERDGQIIETTSPNLGTVHLNIFKTLPGINNDNSVGIEMVHSGNQVYSQDQRAAVIKLVSYLQDYYYVADENIITHCYAQQGDHRDPVGFDWNGFLKEKSNFRNKALALKRAEPGLFTTETVESILPIPSIYLEIHRALRQKDSFLSKEQKKSLGQTLKEAEHTLINKEPKGPEKQLSASTFAASSLSNASTTASSAVLPLHSEIEIDATAASFLSNELRSLYHKQVVRLKE